jgi:magnesium transporter
MIQYFQNSNQKTYQTEAPENGSWVNVLPPLKHEEFSKLSEELAIPMDFLTDSLDIDERTRFEEEDNVRLIVIKTPTENNSSTTATPSTLPFRSASFLHITRLLQ